MRFYKNRESLYLDFLPGMVAVEVGVQRGLNAANMLKARPIELHLVDDWHHRNEGDYTKDPANLRSQADQDFLFGEVLEKFRAETQAGLVHIHRLPSITAAQLFGEGSVDVALIDAEHTYEAVYADLLAWEPTISERGVIMLHDFVTTPQAEAMGFGVFDAATQFMDDRKWKPIALSKEGWDTLVITRR